MELKGAAMRRSQVQDLQKLQNMEILLQVPVKIICKRRK